MMTILNKLHVTYDFLRKRFSGFVAESADEIAECIALREAVFGEELGRKESRDGITVGSSDRFDEGSVILGLRDKDSSKVIGTMRLTAAAEFRGVPEYWDEYQLGLIPEALLHRCVVISRFAILKEFRQNFAGLVLVLKCYEVALERSFAISCIVCEPGLYPMYRRLGFKPLARVHTSPFGGFRLPLYAVGHDYEYMKSIDSPLLKIAKRQKFPKSDDGILWERYFLREHGTIDPGFAIGDYSNDGIYLSLIDGLSENGKEMLLHHSVQIKCNAGDRVIAKGGGERSMGFIAKGALEVWRDEKVVAVLGEGDVFGELAFILDIPRTADLIAVTEDTEVTLLSLKAIMRLKDPEDRAIFWRNMSKILAKRIMKAR